MSIIVGIVWGFVKQFWPYIVGALVIWYGWHLLNEWCNGACLDARKDEAVQKDRAATALAKLDTLDKARIQQDERWAQATAAEDERGRRDAASRSETFTAIRKRVLVDPVVAAAVLPPVLTGVLDQSFAAAEPARAAEVATGSAAPNPSAAAWAVDTLQWEAECRDRVSEWQRFYQSLRSANVVAP